VALPEGGGEFIPFGANEKFKSWVGSVPAA
jgi:hypothetical protein